jgi:hypothetical protein
MQLASLNNCPWGMETAVIQNLLERLQQLLTIFLDSLVVMVVGMLVLGYGVVKDAVTKNELKFLICSVVVRFAWS